MDKKKQPLISVIIPTYNESATIQGTLEHLRPWKDLIEIIIADASTDGTASLVSPEVTLIQAPRGRASQMNAGAGLHVVKCFFSCTVIHACLMTSCNKLSWHYPITKSSGAPLK
jgi:cellulose synthase/poly-beta-1,6-N-acetylglucosamine synthase-like glycosyltransferase